jgi:hydrogenase expression/formation protein HypC
MGCEAIFLEGDDRMCLAIPGRIVEVVSGQDQVGVVEVAGVRRKVQLELLAEDMPTTGDWVLIHVGFAMSKISEADAAEQMHLLSMLGESEQAMEEVRGYGMNENVSPIGTEDRPSGTDPRFRARET